MIALGSDHGGFDLKERVKAFLDEKNIPYKDSGPFFCARKRKSGGDML